MDKARNCNFGLFMDDELRCRTGSLLYYIAASGGFQGRISCSSFLFHAAGAKLPFASAGVAFEARPIAATHAGFPAGVHLIVKLNIAIVKAPGASGPTVRLKMVADREKSKPVKKIWMMLLQHRRWPCIYWTRKTTRAHLLSPVDMGSVIFAVKRE
jgi:hypothetical protein